MSLSIEAWLRAFITRSGGVAGTVHLRETGDLALAAALHIPPPVLDAVRTIPKGKGMAGLAWERDEPVHTCNLKTDATGDVRPGARAVDAGAAVAIPIHARSGEVRGVVGVAFAGERDITESELARLCADAEGAPS